jgi:chromosome segregation ATPase
MFAFVRNLVGVKTDQAVNAGVEALVRWDPTAATEAELRTMEQHLDELGQEVARARQAFDKEQREADAINQLSHQRMAAAEQLQKQADAETDPARKAALQKSLETLVSMLEQMSGDVDRETKDAADAHDFLQQLESAYADAGGKLKQARSDLDRAHRDMSRAEQQRDMADRQAESARRAAGLASTTSGLNIALKAMQDTAAKDLASADAARAKAKLLAPSAPEKEDPNIAAALAAASGTSLAPVDLGGRLAALRARQQ